MSSEGPGTPWSRADLVRLVALVAVGAVIVGLAWNGTSTKTELEDQTAWISVGLAGLGVAVVGQALWLLKARKVVTVYAAQAQRTVAGLVQPQSLPPAASAEGDGLVAADGLAHFHRSGCPIARGAQWRPLPRQAHEAAGRTPCGICRP